MMTCRPDIAFTSVKLLQSNSAPVEHHYHGLKHTIRYIYITWNDGIYFWWTWSRPELPEGKLLTVNSNQKELLLDDCPDHNATTAVAYGDFDWATCIKTRCSFTGICIQLAGGMVAYKTKFQRNSCAFIYQGWIHGRRGCRLTVSLCLKHPLGSWHSSRSSYSCLQG